MNTNLRDIVCKVVRSRPNRSALASLRYIWRKDTCKRKDGEIALGGITFNTAVDSESISSGHDSRSEVLKHIVLSTRRENGRAVQTSLLQLCRDWVTAYSPGRDWVCGIHSSPNSSGTHAHLLVRNTDDAGKCLRFDKRTMYEMASTAWTSLGGPAKGKVSGGIAKFVEAHEPCGIKQVQPTFAAITTWTLKNAGVSSFQVARRDKDNRILSIRWQNNNYRLKSIAAFLDAGGPALPCTAGTPAVIQAEQEEARVVPTLSTRVPIISPAAAVSIPSGEQLESFNLHANRFRKALVDLKANKKLNRKKRK